MKGQFLKVGTKGDISRFFWVLGKDHTPNFIGFSRHI